MCGENALPLYTGDFQLTECSFEQLNINVPISNSTKKHIETFDVKYNLHI